MHGSQFKERYADYKVPLVAINGSSFKKLKLAPEVLGLSSQDVQLLTNSSVEDGEEGAEAELSEEDEELAAEAEEEEKPKKMTRRRGAPKQSNDIEARLAGRFVNLVDLLPALPEKGMFDVQLIKESQYFFS